MSSYSTMETLNEITNIPSNQNKIGKKRKLLDEQANNDTKTNMNEPPSKKQRIAKNIPPKQQEPDITINPLIIQLKSIENPMNKTIEISQNRIFQKSIIKDMKKLDEKTVRKLLLHIIQNSDEAVKLLTDKLPANLPQDEELHCIICHTNYHEQYNGTRACILEGNGEGECGRGECPCGGWDCLNGSCTICNKSFCEGDGDHECRIGKHISDPNSRELEDLDIPSCDEACDIQSDENDSNDSSYDE
eukprot:433855_1